MRAEQIDSLEKRGGGRGMLDTRGGGTLSLLFGLTHSVLVNLDILLPERRLRWGSAHKTCGLFDWIEHLIE